MDKQFKNKENLDKYKIFALNMLIQIFELIERLGESNRKIKEGSEEFKNYLKEIYIQIENLAS